MHLQDCIPFRLTVLFGVLFFAASISTASARTVTVECGEGTISNALKSLDPEAANTVRVMGSCHDSVSIYGFANLTLQGISFGSNQAAIHSVNNTPVFWIVGSHVQINNLIIDGGVYGVMCREFSVCRFSGNTIQNTTGNGVNLDSADATFSGDTFQNNLNYGLILTASRVRLSQVTIKGTTAGPWGPGNGLEADSGSTVTIEQFSSNGNQGDGVSLIGNSHLVNRPWAGSLLLTGNGNGGIWLTEQSSADLSGATVTGNAGGGGIVIDQNSDASFWGGGTVTGNQPMDLYCGALNGIAAAPQLATVGITNCPNTY